MNFSRDAKDLFSVASMIGCMFFAIGGLHAGAYWIGDWRYRILYEPPKNLCEKCNKEY